MSVTSKSTYAQSIASGMPFWRLQITNWGNRGVNADTNSLEYIAAGVGSAQQIVMGPDSTADEVLIVYNDLSYTPQLLAKQNADINASFPPGDTSDIIVTIGIHKPGAMLPGPLRIRTAYSTQFYDTYYRDGDPNPSNFGGAEPLFERPTLQLLVYPEPPTVPIFAKRSDMYRNAAPDADSDVGEEQLIGIWPVMGRSCKSVYFRATGDLVGTVRVGGISTYIATSGGVVNNVVEDTVSGGIAVNAVTGVQASITTGRPMQFLAAYVTRTSGAGTIITNLVASDCG